VDRHIVHMDLDAFFVSVERLLQPELIGKPVIVGGSADRGVVAACSYEARAYGVHSAMSGRLAKQLCPNAIFIRGDHENYSKYSRIVTDIIKENVPLYEKTSIDEFYIDLSGMDKYFGAYKLASELRQRITKETNLPISFALSSNKTVSKIGTGEAKPNGQIQIAHGNEIPFLAPLSVKKIPMVGEKTYQTLRSMGIEWIKTLQQMPIEMIERLLGANGVVLWNKANGIDNSEVVAYNERKSISTETTFDTDTIDVHYLKNVLSSMVQKLGYQLRNEKKLTGCIAIKIRYSDFNTHTQQIKIPYTALDHVLMEKAKELFDKLFNKRLLIRLVGVRFSHLIEASYQFDLFEDKTEQVNLYNAIDSVKNRFGEDLLTRASTLKINSRGRDKGNKS
jgi:DNA polymerase IV